MTFNYQEALFRTAEALERQGNLAEAVFHLERLAANFPSANAFWRLGEGFMRVRALDGAEQALGKALELDPAHASACLSMASLLRRKGQSAGALDLLKRYLSRQENAAVRTDLDRIDDIRGTKERPKEKVVVFVSDDPRVRQAKLAYGLRNAGWKVVLLYHKVPNFSVAEYFDEAHRYMSEPEAVDLARNYPAEIYHVFSIWGDLTSVELIRSKPGKVVYDYWDIAEGIKAGAGLVKYQRYCIENADGLCCRDLRAQYVIRAMGYKSPRRILVLPDCCWNKQDARLPKAAVNGEIHVVVCGYIGIEKRGETDNGYLDIARQFTAQDVHLHIYPHPTQVPVEEQFSDYLALAERTPFLHVHSPVPMDAVIPELSKYQAGVSITRALTYGKQLTGYDSWYLRYCGSARLFDYLDAGLPMILNKELAFQYSLFEPYRLVLDATPQMLSQARSYLERFLTPDIQDRARDAREIYSVQNQIGRLVELYNSLQDI
jgi:tetratricopeptide (TPR) repeat protein